MYIAYGVLFNAAKLGISAVGGPTAFLDAYHRSGILPSADGRGQRHAPPPTTSLWVFASGPRGHRAHHATQHVASGC